MKRIIALLLATINVVSLCSCGVFGRQTDTLAEKMQKTEEEIIQEIQTLSDDLGYTNALAELTMQDAQSVIGDTYYRMQQNYQGIPVFGKSICYVTDENGQTISVTGNATDVDTSVSLYPTISEAEANASFSTYMGQLLDENVDAEVLLDQSELTIYISEDGKSHLAYCTVSSVDGLPYQVIIDAHSAEVLLCYMSQVTENITAQISDNNGKSWTVNCDKTYENGQAKYTLEDSARRIRIYNAHDKRVETELYNKEGQLCYNRNDSLVNRNFTFDELSLRLYPEESVIVPTCYGAADSFTTEELTLMENAEKTYDFFKETFGMDGFGRKNDWLYAICNDDMKCGRDNAYSWGYAKFDMGMTVISFGTKNKILLDTVAHEYTHAVENRRSKLVYFGQSGAIKEALADIFGELVQDWSDGTMDGAGACDWIHGDRNLCKPKINSVSKAKPMGKGKTDNGHVHDNSTIISHTAYLMWNGIDGNNSKKLSAKQLAELWYRTILMLPSDSSFIDCRDRVEKAAAQMKLPGPQCDCIAEAFDAVGIIGESNSPDYKVGLLFTLSVLDKDGAAYDNYSYRISGKRGADIRENIDLTYSKTVTVNDPEPQTITLAPGIYTLTIMNNIDAPDPQSFTVKVDNTGKDKIEVRTDYGRKPLVEDAYSYAYTEKPSRYNQYLLTFAIPRINLDGQQIDALNKEIYNDLYEDIQNSTEALEKDDVIPWYGEVSYKWAVNDDVLSLWVHRVSIVVDNESWRVYNISVSEKKTISAKQVVEAYGMSQQTYREKAKQAMVSCLLDNPSFDWYYNECGADDWLMDRLENTGAEANIDAAVPFINEKGQLCIIGHVYSFAGGDSYQHLLNLETFCLSERYGKDFAAEAKEGLLKLYQDVPEPYASFLRNEDYKDEMYGENVTGYCLFDIDQDGTDELVLSGFGGGASVYQVFCCDTQKTKLVFAGSGDNMSGVMYSPASRAIISMWRDMNNMKPIYSYSVEQMKNRKLEYVTSFFYYSAEDSYEYENGKSVPVSEREKYLADTIYLEFTDLEKK